MRETAALKHPSVSLALSRKPAAAKPALALAIVAMVLGYMGATKAKPKADDKRVVVYASLDREFSEPILKEYEAKTGVRVLPKFDVESTKTVGLTQLLIAESRRPRCDLFWNNEILNTLRLKKRGLLATFHPAHAGDYPENFRAKDGTWYGFGARARILLVNRKLVSEDQQPNHLADLADPRWKGKIGIAKPLFGTTATHASCLYTVWGPEKTKGYFRSLKANGLKVFSGNKQVAQAVGNGEIAVGLTDTDDAIGEIEAGRPVAIVYPDRKAGELGTLFIPNTLAILKGASSQKAAAELAGHLLSPAVEAALADGPSAQIPLNPKTRGKVQKAPRIETPETVESMKVDWEAAVESWEETAKFLTVEFAG